MLGELLLCAIGLVGVYLIYISLKTLAAVKILFFVLDWSCKMVYIMLGLLGLLSGVILYLIFVAVPASMGVDVDVAFFFLIFGVPYFIHFFLFSSSYRLK